MGGNPVPQPTAVVENKSAAEALKAELGFAPAPAAATMNTPPISAKAALKRKVEVMEEENADTETDNSAPGTPIPKLKSTNGVVEDVEDTVRYTNHREPCLTLDYGKQATRNGIMPKSSTSTTMKTLNSVKSTTLSKLN